MISFRTRTAPLELLGARLQAMLDELQEDISQINQILNILIEIPKEDELEFTITIYYKITEDR